MRSRIAFVQAHNLVLRGKVYSVKSFVSSASTALLKQHTRGKRLSAQERRGLLEEFVNKYRSSNQGRFPTISHARQHIGGSHYTIRQIIQEMEYNHKMSAESRHGDFQTRKMEKEKFSSSLSDLEENLSFGLKEVCDPHKEAKETVGFVVNLQNEANGSVKKLEYLQGKKSPLSEDFKSKSLTVQRIVVVHEQSTSEVIHDSTKSSVSSDPKDRSIDAKNEPESCSDSMMPKKLEGRMTGSYYEEISSGMEDNNSVRGFENGHISIEAEQISSHDLVKSEELYSEKIEISSDGESSPKGPGLWNNLKSLAGGIISLWKKRKMN